MYQIYINIIHAQGDTCADPEKFLRGNEIQGISLFLGLCFAILGC